MLITNNSIFTKEQIKKLLLQNNQDVEFSFDIEENKIIDVLNTIFDVENELYKENITTYINFSNLKTLPFSLKKICFKTFLLNYEITNPYILLNIITFIRAYNDFSDDFFDLDNIYFNDITEFLDLKLELKNEFDNYITEFTKWYFSIFRSIHKIEFNFLENFKKLPLSFEKIIMTSDYNIISGIITKTQNFEVKDLCLVENAMSYITVLSNKMNIGSSFFNLISDKNN